VLDTYRGRVRPDDLGLPDLGHVSSDLYLVDAHDGTEDLVRAGGRVALGCSRRARGRFLPGDGLVRRPL
jgi:hypothetical protein